MGAASSVSGLWTCRGCLRRRRLVTEVGLLWTPVPLGCERCEAIVPAGTLTAWPTSTAVWCPAGVRDLGLDDVLEVAEASEFLAGLVGAGEVPAVFVAAVERARRAGFAWALAELEACVWVGDRRRPHPGVSRAADADASPLAVRDG